MMSSVVSDVNRRDSVMHQNFNFGSVSLSIKEESSDNSMLRSNRGVSPNMNQGVSVPPRWSKQFKNLHCQ